MNPKLQARFETLKASGYLPSPKGPALAVVQLTRQDNVSATQLAHAIQADPALVARLLKLANACHARDGRPVLSIKDAISTLGLTSVRGLALGFSLMADKQSFRCREFNYPTFWSRNLARAVAMHALAALSHLIQSDEAFTLGLLSHIGELGLASVFPEDYAQLLENAEHAPLTSAECLDAERLSFEFDHAELTAALLADWGFPASLIEPVRVHEHAEAANFVAGSRAERLLFTLMLASKIADICMAAKPKRRAIMAELFLLGGKLSIGAEDLLALCDGIVLEWTDWCRLLEVPSQKLPPFVELMNAPPAPFLEQTDGLSRVIAAESFRVLVVDDDRSIRLLLKSLLVKAGYVCSEAENGRRGLELARAELPDLMIVDWMMPEMDGIELIRALRETESGRAIYVLLLTGLDDEERLVEAFAAGADDFLSKPLKSNVLTARLVAGQRVVTLQREMKRDLSNLQSFATEFANLNQRLQEGYQKDQVNQKRMELALDGGDLGMWDLHIPGGEMVFSERGCAMLGYRTEEIRPDIESWRRLAHPEDLAAIDAALQSHLKGEAPSYECEYRIRHKDDHWVWILDRGRVVEWNEAGAPLRAVGTYMDITERKQNEEKLHLAASVFTHAHEGIIITDPDGTIIDVNATFTAITGYSRDEVLGKNPHILSSGRQEKAFFTSLWQDLTEKGHWHGEIWNRHKSGAVYAEMLTLSAVYDAHGKTRQYVGMFSDITERKKLEDQIRQMAFYDPLTHLPNRRLLTDRITQTMAVSKRSACYGAVMFLDLDNFKPLNDAHGHVVGDLLLIKAANRLISCVREIDTVARFGGDEFVVLISDIDIDQAESVKQSGRIADKIRIALSAPYLLNIQHEGETASTVEHHCTASIGVALFCGNDAGQDDVFKWADAAMYQAKNAGRNQIRFHDAQA